MFGGVGHPQFNLAQEPDTVSLVTEPEDGFDDDPPEEDDVVSEVGLEILSDQESEVEVPFRLPGAMAGEVVRACFMKTVHPFLEGAATGSLLGQY